MNVNHVIKGPLITEKLDKKTSDRKMTGWL